MLQPEEEILALIPLLRISLFFFRPPFGFIIGLSAPYLLLLHWLTLAGLGTSKMDAILRSWLTLLYTILYTIILSAILVICYVDPDMGSENLLTWSDLEIVKKPFFLNLIIFSGVSLRIHLMMRLNS